MAIRRETTAITAAANFELKFKLTFGILRAGNSLSPGMGFSGDGGTLGGESAGVTGG